MASVSLDRVRKAFPGAPDAVHELSLEIADGEFVSLVGPSGCGKSTTLNLIAGLDQPTSGSIRIDGKPVEGLEPGERDIAMVFQSYALYPHKDVRGNLAFPLEVARLERSEIDKRIAETAELLGIYQRPANRFVAEFFGTPRINVVPARVLGLEGDDLVGIRPEQIELLSERASGVLEATVEEAEMTGAELWVTLSLGGESMVAR